MREKCKIFFAVHVFHKNIIIIRERLSFVKGKTLDAHGFSMKIKS